MTGSRLGGGGGGWFIWTYHCCTAVVATAWGTPKEPNKPNAIIREKATAVGQDRKKGWRGEPEEEKQGGVEGRPSRMADQKESCIQAVEQTFRKFCVAAQAAGCRAEEE